MATYEVHYSCGHAASKKLYGKMADRERFMDWAARAGICPACNKADEGAQIEAQEQEMGLAPLTGSDKQIAWARKLRFIAVKGALDRMVDLDKRVAEDKRQTFEDLCAKARLGLASQTDSRFWIDGRDLAADQLISRATKA